MDTVLRIGGINESLVPDLALMIQHINKVDPSLYILSNYFIRNNIDNFICAFLDKEIVGCVLLEPVNTTHVELRTLGVKPTFRDRGIGLLLIKHALLAAKISSFKYVVTDAINPTIFDRVGFIAFSRRYLGIYYLFGKILSFLQQPALTRELAIRNRYYFCRLEISNMKNLDTLSKKRTP